MAVKTRPRPEKLLTTEQAAEMLGIAPQTLAVWRCKKRYDLPFVRIGSRRVRYRPEDIAAWLDANSSSTGEVTGRMDDD